MLSISITELSLTLTLRLSVIPKHGLRLTLLEVQLPHLPSCPSAGRSVMSFLKGRGSYTSMLLSEHLFMLGRSEEGEWGRGQRHQAQQQRQVYRQNGAGCKHC